MAIPTAADAAAHDPHLAFWLEYCERRGALVEEQLAQATVVLPPDLLDQLHASEVITVTSDPEVAREEGAILMVAGHPYLDSAVDAVLAQPDAGNAYMPWPSTPRPTATELVQRARDSITVDHGKVDRRGEPASIYVPLLHAGVLVTYAIDRPVQEVEEAWVDGLTATPLAETDRHRLLATAALAAPDGGRPTTAAALERCLQAVQAQLAKRVRVRALALETLSAPARREELDRTRAFYQAALESLQRREAGAAPERRRLYAARAVATREELARRLREVEDKYRSRAEMTIFRLHLLWVPAYQLAVDIRRGDRAYPLELFWLPDLRAFAPIICPQCGAPARLVASKQRLGCMQCQHPPAAGPLIRAPSASAAPATSEDADGAVASAVVGTETRVVRSGRPESIPLRDLQRELLEFRQEEARLERIGDRFAPDFWGMAAAGRKWPRVGSDSPLSLLYTLYGPRAAFVAIGCTADVLSEGLFYSTYGPGVDHTAVVIGRFAEDPHGGSEVSFTLRWRASGGKAVVSEVLPGRNHLGPQLPRLDGLPSDLAEHITVNAPRPRVSLGPVARLAWEVEVQAHGIPMAARCAVAWQRLRIPVPAAGEAATAAAVAWIVGRAATLPRKRDQTAAAYDVEPGEMVRAAHMLKPHLAVSAGRPW
ncbi:MAG: hypothetical protein ACYDGR_04785 [Candidatus Dormibacteria bacterium]